MESRTATILARPQLPPPIGIRIEKPLLKGKAPCGESGAIEPTECMITSPGFTEGVSSLHMTPVPGKDARTYKSKAKVSKDGLQTPISNAGSPGTPPPWNPQFMPPRPQDNYYPLSVVHHVDKQPHYGISSYGRYANSTAAPSSENQHNGSSQLSQKMQVPFHYADAVIGSAGANISYIRKHSGATISIQEGVPGGITVEITGSASQVQTAQHLIKNSYLQITASLMSVNETECSNISSLDGRQTIREQNPLLSSLPNRPETEDSVSENVNWLNLQPLVLWQVWKSLCNDSDRIRMQLVCRDWHKELPKLLAPRPWVLGTEMEDRIYHCINRDSLQEMKFRCKVPAGRFCGSCNDFLTVEARDECSLWNPSDGMILALPFKSYVKIVMPKASNPSAFAHSLGKDGFSYGRPTDPGSWKKIICFDKTIRDICPCGTEFYALNSSFRLYKLDREQSKLMMVGPEQRTDEIRRMLVSHRFPDHIFLAELNQELLVICLGRNLQSANLFKVVWRDAKTTSLAVLEDLDGWSLFLGKNQSIALNARDFPWIYKNCLYVALEAPELNLSPTVHVYNLQTRTLIDIDYSRKLGTPFFYHLGTGDVL